MLLSQPSLGHWGGRREHSGPCLLFQMLMYRRAPPKPVGFKAVLVVAPCFMFGPEMRPSANQA